MNFNNQGYFNPLCYQQPFSRVILNKLYLITSVTIVKLWNKILLLKHTFITQNKTNSQ